MDKNLLITPDTKINTLLESYPQLEDTFMNISPNFEKLRNPFLRKTIAKVTTLRQAAIVGNVSLSELINTLRNKVGLEDILLNQNKEESLNEAPEWLIDEYIKIEYNAEPDLAQGIHPVQKVTKEMESLNPSDIYLLITPFVPAPLIDLMNNKGYKVYTKKSSNSEILTYIKK